MTGFVTAFFLYICGLGRRANPPPAFKTGGVDGCDCAEILRLIEMGKIDTTPLITHRFPLDQIETAYQIFENRQDGVIKVAVTMEAGM